MPQSHRHRKSCESHQQDRFWHRKSLEEMTDTEWESLCDGCGRCCLHKFENKKTGKVHYSWVACYLLDPQTCRCTDYHMRTTLVPGCLILRQHDVRKLRWLPKTCAYRLVAQGFDLPLWHPLISGTSESVHANGISVRDKALSEVFIHPDDVEYYMVDGSF